MVQAWYMDPECKKDQREDHKCCPDKPVSLDDLKRKTGVEYFSIPVAKEEGEKDYGEHPVLTKMKAGRGYTYEDDITISEERLPNYYEKIKSFFEEHLHSDEEIRYILEGSGYFDVRDDKDAWIRIAMSPGDLIILPAGIYHRFTLDVKNYIRARRYFVGTPVWTPHNRDVSDKHPARLQYLKDHKIATKA